MKKRNDVRLYNMLFPMYMVWLVPIIWIIIIPANFLIDSAVLLIALSVLKLPRLQVYKKTILKIWGFGFLADFIGSAFLFATSQLGYAVFSIKALSDNVRNAFNDYRFAVDYNPYSNIFALFTTLLAIAISGFCIYKFDLRVLRKTELSDAHKKRVALMLAIFTAPYMLLVPASLFF